jgi:hypothetical protein
VRFHDAGTGRSEVVGRSDAIASFLDVVARRLEGGRPGARFPLLQLLRRSGPVTSPQCGALVFEVARLRVLLGGVPCEAPDAPDPAAFPAAGAAANERKTLAEAYAWPLGVLDHFSRLAAASGDGARFDDVDEREATPAPLRPAAAARAR